MAALGEKVPNEQGRESDPKTRGESDAEASTERSATDSASEAA